MSEIIFVIEEDTESGYIAKALNHSIYTQGETIQELKNNINDAVLCHFNKEEAPKIVRLHFVRDEVFALS
jgi:predicted RNase H-like HicB family nuclease